MTTSNRITLSLEPYVASFLEEVSTATGISKARLVNIGARALAITVAVHQNPARSYVIYDSDTQKIVGRDVGLQTAIGDILVLLESNNKEKENDNG